MSPLMERCQAQARGITVILSSALVGAPLFSATAVAQRARWVPPGGEMISIPGQRGPVRVRNFYRHPNASVDRSTGEFHLITPNYSIHYEQQTQVFHVVIHGRFDRFRGEAELGFLELLGGRKDQVCALGANLMPDREIDPSLWGLDLPLSFCETLGAIRRIDFRNFTYRVGPICSQLFGGLRELRVTNGEALAGDERGDPRLRVDTVVYGDLTGDGDDEATVVVECNQFGLEQSGVVSEILAYTMEGRSSSLLDALEPGVLPSPMFGWSNGYLRVSIDRQRLVVARAAGTYSGPRRLDWLITTRYRWTGQHLAVDTQARTRCRTESCWPLRRRRQ